MLPQQSCATSESNQTDLTNQTDFTPYQQEQEFKTLVENSPDGIIRIDRQFRFIYVNPTVERNIGIAKANLLGKTSRELGLPEHLVRIWEEAIARVFTTGAEQCLETQEPMADGVKTFSSRIVPEVNSNGEIASVMVVSRDITDLKQVQTELLQLTQLLENQVKAQIVDLEQALQIETLLKRITDQVRDRLDEDEILETVVYELGTGLALECCDTGIYNAEQTTSTIAHEFIRSPNSYRGRTFAIAEAPLSEIYPSLFRGQSSHFCNLQPFSLRPNHGHFAVLACPIRDNQKILGDLWLFKACRDTFSELEVRLVEQVANQCAIALRQSRLYQAAQAQVMELARLNQLKDDFLSSVSHELRTPMANIKVATELLEMHLTRLGVLPAELAATSPSPIARYFHILKDEGEREICLINDLLDLARVDAQTEPPLQQVISLQHWIGHLVEPFLTRSQQQQQQLIIDLPPDLPSITSDMVHLQRIVSELLMNACKYTPRGETIQISARAIDSGIELRVANSGVEIAETELERIFDRFYRIPGNDPWRHGGTGLGLALVKKLTEFLGGTIRVSSNAGLTQFIIQLPQQLGRP